MCGSSVCSTSYWEFEAGGSHWADLVQPGYQSGTSTQQTTPNQTKMINLENHPFMLAVKVSISTNEEVK